MESEKDGDEAEDAEDAIESEKDGDEAEDAGDVMEAEKDEDADHAEPEDEGAAADKVEGIEGLVVMEESDKVREEMDVAHELWNFETDSNMSHEDDEDEMDTREHNIVNSKEGGNGKRKRQDKPQGKGKGTIQEDKKEQKNKKMTIFFSDNDFLTFKV